MIFSPALPVSNRFKTLLFISTVLMMTLPTMVSAKDRDKHRHAGKHSHGHAEISIGFDGPQGELSLKGAAEPILGFEYLAKTEQQKATVEATKKIFQTEISNFFVFDKALGCSFTVKKLDQVPEASEDPHEKHEHGKKSGQHSDWEANFSIQCQKSPLGTDLTVDLTRFKKLKDVDITVLIDTLQKTFEYKGKAQTFSLK